MFSLSVSERFYLYVPATDMRKSFDGLCGIIQSCMKRNPRSGEVYVFVNRRRDRMKLLRWEPGGFILYYKRLESGTFPFVRSSSSPDAELIDYPKLVMMIQGLEPENIRYRKRYKQAMHC